MHQKIAWEVRSSRTRRMIRGAISLFAGLFVVVGQAHSAGAHFAVDDAAILEPGECQIETWAQREAHATRSLIHLGPACRVGPVELTLNIDRARMREQGTTLVAGPEVKWAHPLSRTLSLGTMLKVVAQDTSPHFVGTALVVPLTWQAHETLLVHVNIGRDFLRGDRDETRAGAALEWAPVPAWSFVAERFREGGVNYWRAGARYAASSAVSIDLSQARGVSGSAPAWWTIGLNWVFARPASPSTAVSR